jgi:hypothetical protein
MVMILLSPQPAIKVSIFFVCDDLYNKMQLLFQLELLRAKEKQNHSK